MKILVMGGSRFIGLHVVQELLNRQHQVWVFNRGNHNSKLPAAVKTIVGDRTDLDSLQQLACQSFDAVIDMCAYTREQTEMLLAVLEPQMRFLHCSSGAVYQATKRFPITEDFPLGYDPDEGDYGLNKIAIEELLEERYQQGLNVTILRPGYAYGPDNYIYREARFFERLEKGYPILIPGSGEVLTQCVYVDDIATAFADCVEQDSTIGETYNIMQQYAYTLKGYIEAIFEAVGKTTQVITFEPREAGLARIDVAKVFPFRWERSVVRSIEKAKRHFDYTPISLVEGMKKSYHWWKQEGVWREDNLKLEEKILGQLSGGKA